MKISKFVLFCLWLFTISCSQSTDPGNPNWVDNLIMNFKSQPVGNPPQSIFKYEYKNQIVYFVPAQCCDQFSTLYDKNGTVICLPDGGISGTGDGKCPDFFTERKNEKLIWKDSRAR
jgi:hypothetical protein